MLISLQRNMQTDHVDSHRTCTLLTWFESSHFNWPLHRLGTGHMQTKSHHVDPYMPDAELYLGIWNWNSILYLALKRSWFLRLGIEILVNKMEFLWCTCFFKNWEDTPKIKERKQLGEKDKGERMCQFSFPYFSNIFFPV